MRRVSFIILILASISMSAQNHFLGVKGAANFNNVSGDVFENSEYNTGFATGITYEFRFLNFLSASADLQYQQRGFEEQILYANEIGVVLGETTSYWDYNYLSIPLKAGVILGKKLSGFFNLGLVPSFLLDNKVSYKGLEGEVHENSYDEVSSFDFAGLVEVGGSLIFLNRYKAFISLGYEHSFTPFTNDDFFPTYTLKHYGFNVSCGLRYALKSN